MGVVVSEELADEAIETRMAAEAAVAQGLSELSNEEVSPTEVDVRMSFEPEDVLFSGTVWLDRVVRVQDWLRLMSPLGVDDPPIEVAKQLFEGIGRTDVSSLMTTNHENLTLTDEGIELLRERVERAVELKDKFLDLLESVSLEAATAAWVEAWDESVEETISGPILAKSDIWPISDFASRAQSGRLELSPSYQRGDVWPTKDSQLLIESILRGIPLPSVIILRPSRGAESPFEVVDGKQRLTAILRFMGSHPKALSRVTEVASEHPELMLEELFMQDYMRFRRAWKSATGETLSIAKEREYYFPFKLSSTSAALTGDLAPLRGKYYHAIKSLKIIVGGQPIAVHEVFEYSVDYKIPVIEYTEASPRQIHEVFNLYNKQGKHLNAEEIRNAVYHDLDLMRALAVASGDSGPLTQVTPFLQSSEELIARISRNLDEYRFGDARYRRTKVLSWLVSLLLGDDPDDDGRPRLRSTSQQINHLMDSIQAHSDDPLRKPSIVTELLVLVSDAIDAHASADAWADNFKDTKSGARWQELQLIASLLGVVIAALTLESDLDRALIGIEEDLHSATATKEWQRPKKTQTGQQWEFIAGVAIAIAERLGVSLDESDSRLRRKFGRSGIPALVAARDDRIH